MRRRAGVRARLLVVVLVAVVPVVLLLVGQAGAARDRAAGRVRDEALNVARLLADQQAHVADDLAALLQSLNAAAAGTTFDGTCSALPAVLEAQPAYGAFAMRSADGEGCGADVDVPPGLAPGEQRRTYRHEDGSLVVAVGGDGSAAAGLVPVRFGDGHERSHLPEGTSFVLFDGEGRIYDRAPDEGFAGQSLPDAPLVAAVAAAGLAEGALEVEGLDGDDRLFGHAVVPGAEPPLHVAVGSPTAAAYGPADDDLRRALALVAGTALLALVATLLLAEATVTRPLRQIAEVARRLAAGELGARTGRATGDEIGDVGAALDDLAAAVSRSTEQLAKVAGEREALLRELVGAQDQERRRLAEDIHDETIQALTAAGLRVQRIRRKAEGEELATIAREAEEAVGRAIADLRGLMAALVPEDAGDGLGPLLQRVLADELAPHGLLWDLDVDLPSEPAPEVRSLVARNVREAVRNVAQHAGASRVRVAVCGSGDMIEGSLVDDGRGFDPQAPVADGHVGLRSMRQRTERVGGWWLLTSELGSGTTVRFGVPSLDPA